MHVAYGIVGLKTHAKISLVVRREVRASGATCTWARATTTLDSPYLHGLLVLHGRSHHRRGRLRPLQLPDRLLRAGGVPRAARRPLSMREGILRLIEEQTEKARNEEPARITCKMNSLTDPRIIEALYEASQAGVKIDLVVRGICCLRPGLEGVSENIQVVSLVGRFLEHARVFAVGEGEKMYLGSADLMQRNLDRRVEQLFPLREQRHRDKVKRLLELQLADTVNAWELRSTALSSGSDRKEAEEPLDSQALLVEEGF